MVDVFENIYRARSWGGRGCGPGSELAATGVIARVLPVLVHGVGARYVLDAACGDGSWMPDLLPAGYVGVDIVPSALEAARKYHPHRTYLLEDIRRDPLPHADLVVCRDAMMHMPLEDGVATLSNLRATGATWIVATSFTDGTNEEVPPGGFYHINLEAEPFGLGRPWMVIEDNWRHEDKILGVWTKES